MKRAGSALSGTCRVVPSDYGLATTSISSPSGVRVAVKEQEPTGALTNSKVESPLRSVPVSYTHLTLPTN